MATLVGKQHDPIKLLRDLVELDYDAIEAYEAAIERLDDPIFTAQLKSFCEDHRRHVADLNPVIQDLGGEPVLEGDFKRILTKGKVILGGLVGDKAILSAMKTNEDDTNAAYERAVQNVESVSGFVVSILTRNLGDERRHRAYLEQAIASLEKKTPRTSNPEVRTSAPSFF
jgi:uncharacterized protein (TIGR02284 family)